MSAAKAKTQQIGHADHTKDAAARGLAGTILRPIKITMLGAGSAFTPRLMNDILRIPGDQGGTIALVDIDRERLATMTKLITRLAQNLGKTKWTVIGSADRRTVLPRTPLTTVAALLRPRAAGTTPDLRLPPSGTELGAGNCAHAPAAFV